MKKGEDRTPDPRKFTFAEKRNRKISLLGKRFGRPVFKYRVNRDSKKYSKEISNILNYYKNNADNLEDEIKSGLDMGLLLECIQNTEHLDGNIAELGIFRGGSTIMFDKFLQHIKSKKRIFACDTFTGFPYEDDRIAERIEQNRVGNMRYTSFSYVSEKFKKFNVSDRITIMEGTFEDTLYQRLSDQKFSFIFNDSDLYKSTIFSLDFIYPRLVKGGIMMFHNYGESGNPTRIAERYGRKIVLGERRAVDEFCNLHGIKLNTKKSLPYIQK